MDVKKQYNIQISKIILKHAITKKLDVTLKIVIFQLLEKI